MSFEKPNHAIALQAHTLNVKGQVFPHFPQEPATKAPQGEVYEPQNIVPHGRRTTLNKGQADAVKMTEAGKIKRQRNKSLTSLYTEFLLSFFLDTKRVARDR